MTFEPVGGFGDSKIAFAGLDTFGVGIHYFVKRLKEKVHEPSEVHCHNAFGLAVANSLVEVLELCSENKANILGNSAARLLRIR